MYRDLYIGDQVPLYCGVCRLGLITKELVDGFDPYTGTERVKSFRACPTAVNKLDRSYHDVWEVKNEEPPYFTPQYIMGGY